LSLIDLVVVVVVVDFEVQLDFVVVAVVVVVVDFEMELDSVAADFEFALELLVAD
jgi:hypothetical protein